MKNALKDYRFWIGMVFIISVLLISFLFPMLFDEKTTQVSKIMYSKNGDILGAAPYSPAIEFPFGTDRQGNKMLYTVLKGSKITILTSFGIAITQLLIAGILIFMYGRLPKWIKKWSESITETSYYIPASIIAYILLMPLTKEFDFISKHGIYGTIFVQSLIIALIGVPPLLILLTKEVNEIKKKEHIEAAIAVGARGWYLFKKHIFSYLRPRIYLLFSQQVVQTLILLTHLGLLKLFLGGTDKVKLYDAESIKNSSITSEWSGMIGSNIHEIMLAPWIILTPLIFFALTIIAMNLIVHSIQKNTK